MRIDIPFEIGDPVLVVGGDQNIGYTLTACMFSMSLVDAYLRGNVFRTISAAQHDINKRRYAHDRS